MIPKVIHYCWLSGDPFPEKIRRCMDTWRRLMPDYELKLWSLENFDLASAPVYVQAAVKERKWAFAADYIRVYALYTEGGIYLDSDVAVLRRFDEFLDNAFFSSMEHHLTQVERYDDRSMIDAEGRRTGEGYLMGMMIQAAVMGAEAGCPLLADVLDWYREHPFEMNGADVQGPISPQIYARVAERYGFRYRDEDQRLPGRITIYRSEVFAGNRHEATAASAAIHYCAHSWHATLWQRIAAWAKKMKKNKILND